MEKNPPPGSSIDWRDRLRPQFGETRLKGADRVADSETDKEEVAHGEVPLIRFFSGVLTKGRHQTTERGL